MRKLSKLLHKIRMIYFYILDKVNQNAYKIRFAKYLQSLGVKINPENSGGTWISPTTFIDSSHYDYISIGQDVTISFECVVLVHDYSIHHAALYLERQEDVHGSLYKQVVIGNNVFVGARTIILPGSVIGDNVIIGAGSVVKGTINSNSVYAGNPARYIRRIDDYCVKVVSDNN